MGRSIVFVDWRVADIDSLLASLPSGAEVFILDGASDGLDQIAARLQGRSGIDAIDIVSHGSSGSVSLGSSVIDTAALATHASQLDAIGQSLTESGDILLYGCNVAQGIEGQAFISALLTATGADVAASIDTTGVSFLGGNWVLEAGTGSIEATTLALEDVPVLLPTTDPGLASGKLWSVMADFAMAAYNDDGAISVRHGLLTGPSSWQPVKFDFCFVSGTYDESQGRYANDNAQAFIAFSGDTAVISFGGTDDRIDVADDLLGMYPSFGKLLPLMNAFDDYVSLTVLSIPNRCRYDRH